MKVKALRGPQGSMMRSAFYHAMKAVHAGNGHVPEPRAEDAPPLTMVEKLADLASQEDGTGRWYRALPDGFLEKAFAEWTKDVELVGEYGLDEPVDSGAKLYPLATDALVLGLMQALAQHSSLTATEGKASSSPSTSDSEAAQSPEGSGPSPAPSTGPEGGLSDTTA